MHNRDISMAISVYISEQGDLLPEPTIPFTIRFKDIQREVILAGIDISLPGSVASHHKFVRAVVIYVCGTGDRKTELIPRALTIVLQEKSASHTRKYVDPSTLITADIALRCSNNQISVSVAVHVTCSRN